MCEPRWLTQGPSALERRFTEDQVNSLRSLAILGSDLEDMIQQHHKSDADDMGIEDELTKLIESIDEFNSLINRIAEDNNVRV